MQGLAPGLGSLFEGQEKTPEVTPSPRQFPPLSFCITAWAGETPLAWQAEARGTCIIPLHSTQLYLGSVELAAASETFSAFSSSTDGHTWLLLDRHHSNILQGRWAIANKHLPSAGWHECTMAVRNKGGYREKLRA